MASDLSVSDMKKLIAEAWAPFEEKYFIHEETLADNLRGAGLGLKPSYVQSLESTRQQMDWTYENSLDRQKGAEFTNFKGSIEDITIPASHLPKGIPATIFKPEVVQPDPVIVIFHRGGGLVICFKEWIETLLMSLVNHTNAIFVIGEYRNLPCPEDRFAPFTDSESITQWVLDNKTAVGGSDRSVVGMAGDSAGGQICGSLAYTFPGRLAFQVLVYPVADVDLTTDSMQEFWTMPAFSGKDMSQLFDWCLLFEEPSEASNPRVNPSAPRRDGDPPLSTTPPTLVILAELDPLRDWGKSYARKLRAAGVPVQVYTIEGVTHGFFSNVSVYQSCAIRGHRLFADFLKRYAQAQLGD